MKGDIVAPIMALDAANLCSWLSVGIVGGWMLFPDDERLRDNYSRRYLVRDGIAHFNALSQEEAQNLLMIALDALSSDEVSDLWDDRAPRAHGAGMILYNAGIAISRRDGKPVDEAKRKVQRAVWGNKGSTSKHVDSAVWKKFRAVAALWASFIQSEFDGDEYTEFPCSPPELPRFLAWADGFRRFGEQTIPPRKTMPLLPPNVSVRLPDNVLAKLPSGELTVSTDTMQNV